MYTKKIKYWGGQTEEKNDKKSKNKMQNGKKNKHGKRGGEKKRKKTQPRNRLAYFIQGSFHQPPGLAIFI
jgi:hypothetical protein